MELCGKRATKYKELEKCIVTFSSKCGDRTFQIPGDGTSRVLRRRRSDLPHKIRLEQHFVTNRANE